MNLSSLLNKLRKYGQFNNWKAVDSNKVIRIFQDDIEIVNIYLEKNKIVHIDKNIELLGNDELMKYQLHLIDSFAIELFK